MRAALAVVVLAVVTMAWSSSNAADKLPPAPVHPDTLPTLIESWSLPASLTPHVRNAYAPRIALADKLLYTYDHHGRRLVAVRADSGKVVWHAPVPARSDRAFAFTPYVHGGKVFVANDGYLFAFDAATGKLGWRLPVKGVSVNGLARAKHQLFLPLVVVKGGRVEPGVHVWGVDSRNGRFLWQKKFPGVLGFVSGNAAGAYFVGSSGMVFGLTPDRGEFRWQTRVDGLVTRQPILKGTNLFVTTSQRKTGWTGTGLYCIDVDKGKLRWQTRLSTDRFDAFLYDEQLAVIEDSGWLTVFDNLDGRKSARIRLAFGERPHSLHGTAAGKRAYIFHSTVQSDGFVTLVDLPNARVLATANALPQHVRSMVSAARLVFLDSDDGDVYSYRLDRSQQPKRRSIPPAEFAQQLIDRAREKTSATEGLHLRLAGLGPKALGPIEAALADDRPRVVQAAAQAIGLLRARRAVPALLRTLARLEDGKPRKGTPDPVLGVVGALAQLRDARAVAALAKIMKDRAQGHERRRASFVALGAIGTPAALAPLWAFRAANEVNTYRWQPQAFTPSLGYHVTQDHPSEPWPDKVRQRTSRTVQTKGGEIYTAALSSYLGGYNDVWIGKSDLGGKIQDPLFSGLTRPEVAPRRWIKLKRFDVDEKGQAKLRIEMQRDGKWIGSRPVEVSLPALAKDSDGDRLPDLVERRMRLCLTHADCDGDGIPDSEDLNPLASGKLKLTREQKLFQQAFFAFYAFINRRGIVIVDPGKGPSFEVYGRRDPVLALRRPAIKALQQEAGLHGVDVVSFGGPYPEGGGSGDALPDVAYSNKGRTAKLGMDLVRAGNNAVAYNVSLDLFGKNWVVTEMTRVWSAW